MSKLKLPSGAELVINPAPFETSKALYQIVLEEMKGVQFSANTDMASVFKDIACIGFSSKKIEACLWECFKRCTYNEKKIDKDTFEPLEARDDFMVVCTAVAKENIFPFVKGLYAEYAQFLATIEKVPK